MVIYERRDGCEMVRVVGELVENSAPLLEDALSETFVPIDAALVVDLTECSFILSVGISTLIKAYRLRGKNFRVVVNAESHLSRVFAIVGLDRLFVETVAASNAIGRSQTRARLKRNSDFRRFA